MSTRIAAVGILVAVLGLSGCAGDTGPEMPDGVELGAVSIEEYADVTAVLDQDSGTVKLPLDKYEVPLPQRLATIENALNTRASSCLVAAGFAPLKFTPVANSAPEEVRLYGRWSVPLAQKYGTAPEPGGKTAMVDTSAQGKDYSDKYGECHDAAKEPLGDDLGALTDPGIIYKVDYNAYYAVLKDSEGNAAIEKSLACMEDKGISVQREDGAAGPSEDYQSQPKEEQVRVATEAARCQVDTGATQILYDLTARYQSAYIAQYEAQLKAQSDSVNSHIAALEKIVSEGH